MIASRVFTLPCSAKIPSQLISLDFRRPGTTCCRHEDLAFNRGRTSSQFGRLCVVPSDSSFADPGAPSANRRLQAQVQETLSKKQGSTLLVLAVKDLETMEIGIDSREPGYRGLMEKAEVGGRQNYSHPCVKRFTSRLPARRIIGVDCTLILRNLPPQVFQRIGSRARPEKRASPCRAETKEETFLELGLSLVPPGNLRFSRTTTRPDERCERETIINSLPLFPTTPFMDNDQIQNRLVSWIC